MKPIEVKNFEMVENGDVKYLTFDLSEIGLENGSALMNSSFRFDGRTLVSNEMSITFTGIDFQPNYIAAIDGGQVVWSIAVRSLT